MAHTSRVGRKGYALGRPIEWTDAVPLEERTIPRFFTRLPPMQQRRTEHLSPQDIHRAADILKRGGVVAVPTETVYGLAARFDDDIALRAVFAAKGRPADNPLIVHCANVEQLASLAKMTPAAWLLAEAFMPGPLTLVLEAAVAVSDVVTAGLATLAVRVPANDIFRQLVNLVGVPLAAPSANVSGRPSATTAAHVVDDLDGRIDAVLDGGPCLHGMESTVVDCRSTPVVVLRPGAVSTADVEAALGAVAARATDTHTGSPGMRHRHYAPTAPIRFVESMAVMRQALDDGCTSGTTLCGIVPVAESLYANLRAADALNVEQILVLCDLTVQADEVLMNRLVKASEER